MKLPHSDDSQVADTNRGFGFIEWALATGMALIWGSSFLLIEIIIREAPSTFVPLGRSVFGALALLFMPKAREPIAREHHARLWVLGFIWMALPFFLFPLAERTVATSIAGMMNGALPVVVAIVTALWLKTMPSLQRSLAVCIGFVGIVLIAVPSINEGSSADVMGILYLVGALLCYAVGINIARPLQTIYAPETLMFRVVAISVIWSAPLGLAALPRVTFTWQMLSATIALGALGTGAAFFLFGTLLARTGTVRAMIPTYFTPVVSIFLGVLFNDEKIIGLSIVGMIIVLLGAWLTSRPEPTASTTR
ncbi:MAG: DMT family transporter [Acidimicrobiaceae bacterium]|nr:DMT family transporter [Acidimicrobiaceae bacterium]